jgi:hypothetical protein
MKIEISKIITFDFNVSANLELRAEVLVGEILERYSESFIKRLLKSTRLSYFTGKYYVCDNVALIKALNKLYPGLKADFKVNKVQSADEARDCAIDSLIHDSILSLNAVEVCSFETFARKSERKLLSKNAYARVLSKGRTATNKHDYKFRPVSLIAPEYQEVDIEEVVESVPEFKNA